VVLPEAVSYQTKLASVRVDTSVSTRVFLNVFVQYSSVTGQVSSNVRFQFIHHPLSDIYVVLNDSRTVDFLDPVATPSARFVTVKVTHLFSF
jgi:hypothetical protein